MNEFSNEFSRMATAAITLHELYSSLISVGFADEQALRIVIAYVQSSIAGQSE